MCGIAGILRLARALPAHAADRAIPEAWLDTLEASIAHRGPDGRGRFRDARDLAQGRTIHVALLQRRLSIIDHGGGRQPMLATSAEPCSTGTPPRLFHGPPADATAPCTYQQLPDTDLRAVVFNGCIYNHRALRATLQAQGHRFVSDHSDTETLLHAQTQWGGESSEYLDGMYAVALWHRASATLTLMRDLAGEKPLYLASATVDGDEVLAFSSSPAGLIALRRQLGQPVTIDPLGAMLWLKHGYWSRLPIDLIELAPGTTHVIDPRHAPAMASAMADALRTPVHVIRPTSPSLPPATTLTPQRVTTLLQDAITSRLDADVPIGCFLSGGVDSSIVAAVAQRALQAAGGRSLLTFNVKMPDERFDESPFAHMVARHLGTKHIELTTPAPAHTQSSAADDLVRLITQLGLPFGDSSLLPTHWVSVAARQHVTVALGGDGGDELFAGYQRYQAQQAMARWTMLQPLARALPGPLARRLGGNLGRVITSLRYHGYHDLHAIFRTPQIADLLGADRAATLASAYSPRPVGADARHDDFAHYLPEDLMRKVDTASMAIALEVRAPLLARGLVSEALGTTLDGVFADGAARRRKGLLRAVARSLVPAEAIDRKKQGFGVPMGRWLREDYAGLRTLLNDTLAQPDPWPGLGLSKPAAQKLLAEHDRQGRDHGQRLWMLMVMSVFLRNLRA
ncbi:MAG: asparagine synthase-related protein [Phycisphaerales bacterium]|nr:asparagine synthase-related protein [Phycisphaerales bacterium]